MTACSNEDLTSPSGKYNGETVFVSLNVDRSNGGTRTIINEVDADGGVGLSNVWAKGDQVTLVSKAGVVAGTLTLEGEGGSSEGIFSGDATITDGEYTVWYLGADKAYAHFDNGVLVNALTTPGCSVSGNLADLNKGDLMMSTIKIAVVDGKAEVTEGVTLTDQMAMAHFTLSLTDETIDLDSALKAKGAKLRLSYKIDGVPYSYTITNQSSDIYVPLLPGKYAPMITLISGSTSYKYTFTTPTEVEAGLYYCGNKNADTGKNEGISVELVDEYANEDPSNPLHKFSKYNLERVGVRGSLDNGFVDYASENGALYQWGRNYGYMDTNGIYRENIVSPNEDFTNYIDALGLFDNPDSEYSRILDYYVYNPRPSGRNLYFMTSGTAMRYTPQNPDGIITWYDVPRFYNSVNELKAHPDKYFMDGDPKGGRYCGYGNYGIGMEQKNNQPDYWLSSFGEGGFTWTERAEKCGYTATNPCPEGWRMPTLEEFRAIAPEGQGLDANKSMATMLSGYAEVRKTTDDVNYVIRWIYDSSAITIEAVVVEEAMTKNQVTSKFWDDNRDKKVVRVFPFTGSIIPLITLSDGYLMANDEYVVRPHNRGFLDYTGFPGGYGPSNNYYWMLIGPGDVNNAGPAFGGYWIDEKNYAFKFEAKEIQNGKNTSNSSFTVTSCMFVGSAEPVMGYAIRPVMDK